MTNIHTTQTHKHTQTQTNTHKHTQTHTNTSRSRFWPKSVLAKVGHGRLLPCHVLRTRRIFVPTRAQELVMLCLDVPPDSNSNFDKRCFGHWSWRGCACHSTFRRRRVCGAALDTLGRHRAACPRSGLLKIRAKGPERTLARVCREAGASVRFNAKLRDMNVPVSVNDERPLRCWRPDCPSTTVRSWLLTSQSEVPPLPRGSRLQTPRTPMVLF